MPAPLCSLQSLPGPKTPQPAPDAKAQFQYLMQQDVLPPLEELLAFDQLLRDKENIPPKTARPASPPHTSLTHPEEFEL